MADKQTKKARKRKDAQDAAPEKKDEATKEEYAIAKWMRKNVLIKKTKFLNHTVEYFTACKAVDQLMDSPWAQPKKPGEEALFTTRESIEEYLNVMLRHKMFHRARKIVVPESELKSKKKKEKEKEKEKEKSEKEKSEKESKKGEATAVSKKDETATAAESSQAEGDKTDKDLTVSKRKKDEGEKKKRKIRLDMHLEQRFVDSTDAYVWIYEPTPYYNYFFGFLVVVAVIAVCLFPLWPSSVRQGVYYLSLAAAGFLVFILALAVIRVVLFGIVWGITFGRHHLWLLPNLTEDVGFMASFWPIYKYEYKPGGKDDETKRKRDKSEPKTDDENSEAKELPCLEAGEEDEKIKPADQSETESEGSQPSQTGKDFEMVDREEIES